MNLKEFTEIDDWKDSHIAYAFQGYVDKRFVDVTHITLKNIAGNDTIVLHLEQDIPHIPSILISQKPCPADLLNFAECIMKPEKIILAFEKNNRLYSFDMPAVLKSNGNKSQNKTMLCVNGIDEEIAFDVGERLLLRDVYEKDEEESAYLPEI